MEIAGAKILVTGATGFVGSHVVESLLKARSDVVVLYRSSDPRSYFFRKALDASVIMAVGDLKDSMRVFDVISKYEIQYILHLGAQAIVPTAYYNPLDTLSTNIMGTVHVLEAARMCPSVHGVIVASSDKAYGKSTKVYKEHDPLRGDHPYEVSKSSADLISLAYAKTYGVPVVVTRFGNIYGPGDPNKSRIVPGIMQAILSKKVLPIRSDGTYVRDYVYVGDVASAYMYLLTHIEKAKGKAFNISSGESLSVIDVVKASGVALKKRILYRIENTAKNEIPYQHLDDSAIRALGWKSHTSFASGIKWTYAWYKKCGLSAH